MRKAFNFYRSYYDTGKCLNDTDRLAFYDGLLKRQFTGEEPELDGMAKFAYISQKHSIDTQVAGYEAKTGIKLTPCQGGTEGGGQGGTEPPSVQVQGQVQVKGKGKEQEKGNGKILPDHAFQVLAEKKQTAWMESFCINTGFKNETQTFTEAVSSFITGLKVEQYPGWKTESDLFRHFRNWANSSAIKAKYPEFYRPPRPEFHNI